MIVRRAVYRMLIPLAVALPVWVLIGRGILADGVGWQFVAYLVICPILFVALMAISGLILVRPDARESKAVSGWDAALMIALWLVLIASGFYAVPVVAVLAVVLVLVGFWLALFELIGETSRRVRATVDAMSAPMQPVQPPPVDLGHVTVISSRRVPRQAPPTDEAHPPA